MALYEFIDGVPVANGEVGKREVDAAIALFQVLNEPSLRQTVQGIEPASESVFSIQQHLAIVDNRIHHLQQQEPAGELDLQAKDFIQSLSSVWREYRNCVVDSAQQLRWELNQTLSHDEWSLSPSDFGFHNAIRTLSSDIRFIDFEYAGWDDPAKMIADFFSQPAVPVPTSR